MLLNPPARLSSERTATRPLRLLLYVEWILLSMGILVSITAMILHQAFQVLWPELLLFGLIGAMGLYLPLRQLRAKIIYTAIELVLFSLLVLRCLDNPLMLRIIPLLGLVIMIRSCQLFQTQGRLVIAGITFGSHLFVSLTLGQTAIRQNISRILSSPEAWQMNVFQTNAIILFSLALLFVFLLVDALLSVHRSQQKLAIARYQRTGIVRFTLASGLFALADAVLPWGPYSTTVHNRQGDWLKTVPPELKAEPRGYWQL